MEHHATLYVGEGRDVDAHIDKVFEKLGIANSANPDVFFIDQESFGVNDARELAERAVKKAFATKKFFVIRVGKFTQQAQNALLKTLEDPVHNTFFLISVRDSGIILPTLLSRMSVVHVGGKIEDNKEVKKFLVKTLKQRMDFAKKFADEKDERGAEGLAQFLDSTILTLREEKVALTTLKKISTLRGYAKDSSVMSRLVIEHLALII